MTPSRNAWVFAALLVIVVVLVYLPVRRHAFTIDVGPYVAENAHVREGISADGLRWAVTGVAASNWHPLTWWSHMLDVELFGLRPAGHHVVNVVFHAANAALIFLLLLRLSGSVWPALLAAALFALHPLRVESVAWVLERKDVLSTLLWLATIGAYARYRDGPSAPRYAAVVLLFALGLASKPMLVTLPLTLWILDFWPLGRINDGRSALRCLVEKLPLLVLSALVAWITVVAQGEAVASIERLSPVVRIQNAVVSYQAYLGKLVWPADLAFYYPHPGARGWDIVFVSAVGLIAVTVLLARLRRTAPYLLAGWAWYGITLVPVIGLVQVGGQALADRYTYVPSMGLCVALALGAQALVRSRPATRHAVAAVALVVVTGCAVATRVQLRHWKDTVALLERSAAVTGDNYFAHYNLANHLKRQGAVERALGHYREALRIEPDAAQAHHNLANALLTTGDVEGAVLHYTQAIRADPRFAEAHYALGNTEMERGRLTPAAEHLQAAVEIRRDPEYLNNLGIVRLRQGRAPEAVELFGEALAARPDARRHNSMGAALVEVGNRTEAIHHFREALRLDPGHAQARRNLDALLATPDPRAR